MNMNMSKWMLIIMVGFLFGCAPSRFVEPLEDNKWAVGASTGGPLVKLDTALVIPVPLSSIAVGYGLDDKTTVYGGVHTTALLFGTGQLDLGVVRQFAEQDKYIPNVTGALGANMAYSPSAKSFKIWPTIDLNLYWNYGERRSYFYFGMNNYFDLSSTLAHNQQQTNRFLLSPQLGHVFKSKWNTFQLTAEVKFIAPYKNDVFAFVDYGSLLGDRGATGVYIGFRKIIGNKKPLDKLED